MKIAIPLANGQLTAHFGHCAEFALITVDQAQKKITDRETVPAPEHEPGKLPVWLAEKGVSLVIAGGMGQRAQDIFIANGISVVVGASANTPDSLVLEWLAGTLKAGENCCDH